MTNEDKQTMRKRWRSGGGGSPQQVKVMEKDVISRHINDF